MQNRCIRLPERSSRKRSDFPDRYRLPRLPFVEPAGKDCFSRRSPLLFLASR